MLSLDLTNPLIHRLEFLQIGSEPTNIVRNTRTTPSASGFTQVQGKYGKEYYVNSGSMELGECNPGADPFTFFQILKTSGTDTFSASTRSAFDQQGYEFLIGGAGIADRVNFRLGTSVTNISGTNISTTSGEYYFALGTYDGSNARLYVDGELASTNAVTGTITNTQNLFIGKRGARQDFVGNIVMTGFIRRVLSQSEISSLYNDPFQLIKSDTSFYVPSISVVASSTGGYRGFIVNVNRLGLR